jgi:hypothetical protein
VTDIEARLMAMAQAHQVHMADERREAFAALKSADPQQAAFLQAIAAEFGKPAAITIRQGGKTYRQGTFDQQRNGEVIRNGSKGR